MPAATKPPDRRVPVFDSGKRVVVTLIDSESDDPRLELSIGNACSECSRSEELLTPAEARRVVEALKTALDQLDRLLQPDARD